VVRLIRLGDGPSEVGADVRAVLSSWGRGDGVVGGVALIGAQPPDCPRPVDAIIVLPRGILVVVGADLPDPAVRLDAPLAEQWRTDGWPLVRGDGAVNPATEALEAAAAIGRHLERSRVEPLPVGVVIAIGPYVSQVFQPTADLARGVRILHPEPMTLLNATRELAVYQRRCSIDGARAVLTALDPAGAALAEAELAAEGFADAVSPGLTAASTTVLPRVETPPLLPKPAPRTPRRSPEKLRWLPIGAAILVALLMITGIVFAVASAGGSSGPAARDAAAQSTRPAAIDVGGVSFQPKGESKTPDCAPHSYGDVQVWLQANKCAGMVRLRFESTVDNRRCAILLAVVRFAESSSADELRRIADTPGGGAVADPSAEGTAWPDGANPSFNSAGYASGREGNSVKLAQAVWLDQPSTADDATLEDLANRALQLPVQD
jgi:hypothetical protein